MERICWYLKRMYTSPRPNLYVSSDGYSVEVLGQTGLRYREAGRSAFIDSEVLAGPTGMLIYADSIAAWESSEGPTPVTEAERDHIIENVRATFRSQGFEVDVI